MKSKLILLSITLTILPILDFVFVNKYADEGSFVTIFVRTFVLVISLFYVFFEAKTLSLFRLNYFNRAVLILLLYFFIQSFTNPNGFTDSFGLLTRILYIYCGYFLFYNLSFTDKINSKYLLTIFKRLIPILLLLIILYMPYRSANRGGLEDFADNRGYLVLFCLPIILLSIKDKMFVIYLAIVAVGILLAGKRGAILGFGISLLVFFYSFLKLESVGRKKKIVFIIMFGFVLISGGYLFIDKLGFLTNRLTAVSDDGGSGRTLLYSIAFLGWLESDLLHQIIGNGWMTQPLYFEKVTGGRPLIAHCDWLQILYDFGLVGVLIYFNVFRGLLKELKIAKKIKSINYYPFLIGVFIFFLKATLGGTYTDVNSFYILISLGFFMGQIDRERKNLKTL